MKTTFALLAAAAAFALASFGAVPVEKSFTASADGSAQLYVEIDYSGGRKGADVLFALHGHGSDRWQFALQERGECAAARAAAEERGMVYVSPDYRACASWMGPKAESDLVDLAKHYRAERGAKHVFFCGASMGACSTIAFALLHPDLVDGFVAMNGMCDFVAYGNFQDAIAESFGGDKKTAMAEYVKRSAIYSPDAIRVPCAFTFGMKDDIVAPFSGIALAERIKALHPELCHIDIDAGRGHETAYEPALKAFRAMFESFDAAHPAK